MDTLPGSKQLNPQTRPSAVAEAVALADAEVKGVSLGSQNGMQAPNVVMRRPLSNFMVNTLDVGDSNTSHNVQQKQPVLRRKPRPSSMALIAPIETQPQCFYCLEDASHVCNWCRVVYYCGPSHYNIHRCHSKCWPFKVKGQIHILPHNMKNFLTSLFLMG